MIPDEEQLRRALNATPEQQQRLAALADAAGIDDLRAAFARAMTAYAPVVAQIRDAVLPEEPQDPRERALWLVQHRGTGPDRQVQHRPRPRRVP